MVATSKADVQDIMEDEFDDGALLMILKKFSDGGTTYRYAAIKIGDRWQVTGAAQSPLSRKGMSSMEFVNFLSTGRATKPPQIFWAKTVYEI